MSRTRLLMAAAVALLLVTGAFFVVTAPWGLPRLARPSAPPETAPVVVAAVDIPAFRVITPNMVTTRDLPKDQVPPGALTKVEDALDRAALQLLPKGEPLVARKLAPVPAAAAVRLVRIQPGMRAFTIDGPSVPAGLADLMQPGNRVDVVLTAAGRGRSITVLEDVEILAMAGKPVPPGEPAALFFVTLLVTQPQVAKLRLAQQEGRLRLVPHPPGEPSDSPW